MPSMIRASPNSQLAGGVAGRLVGLAGGLADPAGERVLALRHDLA